MYSASPSQPAKIKDLMVRLKERKVYLESQLSPKEQLNVSLSKDWEPKRQEKVVSFTKKLNQLNQIVKLEIAILESIKDFVDPEIPEKIQKVFVKVRKSNDLMQMNSVSLRYRDNIKIRQVIKLVNAVYRYNRDVISGVVPYPVIKSTIKHATSCPHCGETSSKILQRMRESKAVLLPS